MGGTSSRLVFTKQIPNVVMIVGLQGSGKTTSTGKISKWLAANQERKPLLVSVDVYRPAAREQLRVVGGAVGIPVFENKASSDPMELVRGAINTLRKRVTTRSWSIPPGVCTSTTS
jgi:signal recognition particle subunit SRP54